MYTYPFQLQAGYLGHGVHPAPITVKPVTSLTVQNTPAPIEVKATPASTDTTAVKPHTLAARPAFNAACAVVLDNSAKAWHKENEQYWRGPEGLLDTPLGAELFRGAGPM